MTPLLFNLGPMELVIILVIVLLLFGGSRLAGLGKSTGRALKEFKEETKGLKGENKSELDDTAVQQSPQQQLQTPQQQQAPQQSPQYPQQQYPQQAPQQFPQYPQQQYPQQPAQNPAPNDVRNDG